MTKPTSLLALQANLAQAISSLQRDELADILTAVLEAYVVERVPRIEGPIGQRTVADLAALPFAQLVTELQMSCEQPELAALRVEGLNVQVRVGGQWLPLTAPTPNLAAPAPVVATTVPATAPAGMAPPPSTPPSAAPSAATPGTTGTTASGDAADAAKPTSAADAGDRFSLLELD